MRKFGSCCSPQVCPKTHLKSTIMIALFLYNYKSLSQESYASQSDGDYFCVALPPTLSDRETEYLARVNGF